MSQPSFQPDPEQRPQRRSKLKAWKPSNDLRLNPREQMGQDSCMTVAAPVGVIIGLAVLGRIGACLHAYISTQGCSRRQVVR